MKTRLLKTIIATLAIAGVAKAQNIGLNLEGPVDTTYDFIEVADDASLDFTDAFTFETWVNFDFVLRNDNGWDWQCLFAKSRFTESYGLMLLTDSAFQRILRFYHTGVGTGSTDYIWSGISADTWYHVAVTMSPTKTAIIIDGVEVASQTFTADSLTPNDNPLFIGAGATAGGDPYPLDGTLEETRLWNVTKTAAEINAARFAPLSGNEAGLVLYYDYSDGVAEADNTGVTTVNDLSSSNNDGTLMQFALTGTESNFVGTSISGFNNTLSNDDFKTIEGVGVGPNPTTGVLNISNTSTIAINQYAVYSIEGKLMLEGALAGDALDLSALSSDIYLVKLFNGNQGATFKIIKE